MSIGGFQGKMVNEVFRKRRNEKREITAMRIGGFKGKMGNEVFRKIRRNKKRDMFILKKYRQTKIHK